MTTHINQLTFTRFLAACAVVVFHFGSQSFPFNSEGISFLLGQSNLGVSYFFMLSGFVMIAAYHRPGAPRTIEMQDYYRNRVARIFPVYWIALILMLGFLVYSGLRVGPVAIATQVLGMQSWIPSYPLAINYPGWSVSVELFFYAIFPLLYNKIYIRWSLPKLLLFGGLLWLFTQVLVNVALRSPFYQGFGSSSHSLIYYFPPMHLSEFVLGSLGAMVYMRIRERFRGNHDLLLLGMGGVLVLTLYYKLPIEYHNGFLALLFVPFMIFMALNTGYLTKVFSLKPLVWLGEISYGMYILQLPVFRFSHVVLESWGIKHAEMLFWLKFFVLLVLSALSYWYIETPLRNRIRNWRLNRKPREERAPFELNLRGKARA